MFWRVAKSVKNAATDQFCSQPPFFKVFCVTFYRSMLLRIGVMVIAMWVASWNGNTRKTGSSAGVAQTLFSN